MGPERRRRYYPPFIGKDRERLIFTERRLGPIDVVRVGTPFTDDFDQAQSDLDKLIEAFKVGIIAIESETDITQCSFPLLGLRDHELDHARVLLAGQEGTEVAFEVMVVRPRVGKLRPRAQLACVFRGASWEQAIKAALAPEQPSLGDRVRAACFGVAQKLAEIIPSLGDESERS